MSKPERQLYLRTHFNLEKTPKKVSETLFEQPLTQLEVSMEITQSFSELGSIPTPHAAFSNTTKTTCEQKQNT